MMEDKIAKITHKYISPLRSDINVVAMDTELYELFEAELKKRLSLYEKLEGDAFVDDIK